MQYDCGTKGVLKIYRDPRSLDGADAGSALLAKNGLVYRRVSPTECTEIEPALQRASNTLVGGLYFERDEVGDPTSSTPAWRPGSLLAAWSTGSIRRSTVWCAMATV